MGAAQYIAHTALLRASQGGGRPDHAAGDRRLAQVKSLSGPAGPGAYHYQTGFCGAQPLVRTLGQNAQVLLQKICGGACQDGEPVLPWCVIRPGRIGHPV